MNKIRNVASWVKALLNIRLASGAMYMGVLLMSPSGCEPECPQFRGNRIQLYYFKDSTMLYQLPYNRVYLAELDSNITYSPWQLDIDVARQQMTAVFINDTSGVQDTVYFRYNSMVNYMNAECGMQFKVSDLRAQSRSVKTQVWTLDEKLNIWQVKIIR